MTRIAHKPADQLGDLAAMLPMYEAAMGFVPNSLLTMAHWPELAQAFSGLAGTILGGGVIDRDLKQLMAFVTSNASGCRYCQAHTSHGAERGGVSAEKLAAAFEFETSPLFSDRERAALRLAARAGMVPNAVEDSDFEALAEHFTEREIVELVALISLFGYLNRWNDTMATTLEEPARAFAESTLGDYGWQVGKHA